MSLDKKISGSTKYCSTPILACIFLILDTDTIQILLNSFELLAVHCYVPEVHPRYASDYLQAMLASFWIYTLITACLGAECGVLGAQRCICSTAKRLGSGLPRMISGHVWHYYFLACDWILWAWLTCDLIRDSEISERTWSCGLRYGWCRLSPGLTGKNFVQPLNKILVQEMEWDNMKWIVIHYEIRIWI